MHTPVPARRASPPLGRTRGAQPEPTVNGDARTLQNWPAAACVARGHCVLCSSGAALGRRGWQCRVGGRERISGRPVTIGTGTAVAIQGAQASGGGGALGTGARAARVGRVWRDCGALLLAPAVFEEVGSAGAEVRADYQGPFAMKRLERALLES